MSLINNAGIGSQIDAMCIIYRILERADGVMTERALMELCRPESMVEKPDQAGRVPGELRFWAKEEHQLWRHDKDKEQFQLVVRIGDGPSSPASISSVVGGLLFGMSMETVLRKDAKLEGVDQLLAALSCMLAAPEFAFPTRADVSKDSLRDVLAKYLPSECQLNDAELPVALEYGHFLGFLEPCDGGRFVVDPTTIVSTALPKVLRSNESMPLAECIDELGKTIPVLDGGRIRIEVEAAMEEGGFVPNPPGKISMSLSHALYRLRLAGMIKLEEKKSDDMELVTLSIPSREIQYSRVMRLTPEAQASAS
jgi:hypothetical protein